MNIFAKLFGRKKKAAPRSSVDVSYVAASGYELSPWPMLPKEVVYFAVEGGWAFDGNIGPQVVLDAGLFRALAKRRSARDVTKSTDDEIGAEATAIAHSAYEYYLHYPENLARHQAKEVWMTMPDEFWRATLKP